MKAYLSGREPRCMECFNFDWYFYHCKNFYHSENSYHSENAGQREKEFVPGTYDVEECQKVQLPHDWSLFYPFDEHAPSCGSGGYVETGTGWYRKLFKISEDVKEDEKIFLRFDGVYMLANVWVNGKELGQHVYGYTPFEWEITHLLNGKGQDNVVDVRVDNSVQPGSRWYSGSGITRNVWLYRVQKAHILPYGIWIRQSGVSKEQAKLRVETSLTLPLGISKAANAEEAFFVETTILSPQGKICMTDKAGVVQDGSMRPDVDSDSAQNGEETLKEAVVCQEFMIDEPMLWAPEHPSLYEVVTKLYRGDILLDEVHSHTGFRSAVFHKEKGFLLNGEKCKLNGVCIHHDGGCVGAAVPPEIWERRLRKLKEMGVNAIRMSHNPPDPALLELCDREGFLVMDEAFDEWTILKGKEFGSNTHESRGYSEWFEQCHEEDLRAMLLRDRNHPCIVIWSIGNEVPDQQHPQGYLTARHLKEICRELDPDRFVTQANDQICSEPFPAKEDFLKELDVVGYNYVGRWRSRAETFYDEDRRAHPDWCMIGTENGGIGGIRGEYPMEMSERAGWWRQTYYGAPVNVGKLLRYTMSHDYVAGDFMWTGIDYLGEAHWPARSSSAGVLDTCGFEKDGYYFYQSIWKRDVPMVHLLPHWNLDVERGTILPVLCYTSCDCVELFLNGKSYGKKAYAYPAYGMTKEYGHFDRPQIPVNTGDLFLSWDVPYEPGRIEAVGYCNGQEAVREIVRTAGAPVKIQASCYQDEITADGQSVGQIEVTLVDADGNFCPQADCTVTFTVEGPAALLGVDNGNPRCHESMKGNQISAFHGKAFALVRSDGNSGTCVIKVSAAGLAESVSQILFS